MSETTEHQQVSLNKQQVELLDQLLKPEVQESLTTLVDQLPKLTELITVMTKSYDFAQSVATDDVLKADTVAAITEILEPVKETAKDVAQTAIEAKERSEASNEVIGIFGLMKLLKDPQAQKLFRFTQAYLAVMNERENKK
ncbi:helical membrane plugin domain-containing protein [Alkalicoccobacillus murimartini]|uniref:Uncharacterized protein YjgD (DUF1641 family) n=1 Tax=Alkalicoccobacillus murimartini TaxID=171685 RepID=A0ABT9YKP7_9BACI|nr:DUF1641 domain-containing protein [Alkalicoccobacillus murimartini]MDQ0208444.1 uncharacterized protein YjgD (DUF1641 family) [Alkalicoccobacillus murimartini]